MSEWKKVKLKDCCLKIGSGSTPKGGSTVYIESGTSLIRSQNVYNLSFDYNGLTHITEDAANKLKGVTIFNDDILLNITGDSVARTCIVPKNVLPARVNQHVAIIRPDSEKMNSRFLNYYLASPRMQAHMLSLAVGKGASRNAMTKQMIENFDVPCPPISTQHRIATILSRYDSLIENYQKQIKLLEEAAQRLYKEWFVDLRFPGHENTKIVNGLPDGWEKKMFGSVIEYEIGGGWGADTKTSNSIIPAYVIRGTDMSALDMGALKELPYRFHQDSNYKARQLMHNDIVFEVSGGSKNEGVAKTFLVQQELLDKLDNHVICASFCKLIRLKDSSTAYYIYDTLKEWRASGITTQYDKRSASSIVNYRWKDFLSQQEIVIPNEIVLRDYIKKSELIHSSITKKSSQIRLLTEARDRLLPKLMSGEIE